MSAHILAKLNYLGAAVKVNLNLAAVARGNVKPSSILAVYHTVGSLYNSVGGKVGVEGILSSVMVIGSYNVSFALGG